MTETQQLLWSKISAFQFDDPDISFNFSHRLARDNGWSPVFTNRVIEEYRRFIFLCCITQTGVTPSDIVDQAWHLHLTYTRSYWNDLCRDTLQKEIHHNPTKGDNNEAKKFDEFYSDTLTQYKALFGQDAPADIWQSNDIRFSDINFQRVNLKNYWLIPKPAKVVVRIFLMLIFLLSGVFFIQAKSSIVVQCGICGRFDRDPHCHCA